MSTSVVQPPFLDRSAAHPIQPQELFDWAARALHTMRRQSKPLTGTSMCLYRSGNPVAPACIAGQLMTDDEIKVPDDLRDNQRDLAPLFKMSSPYNPFNRAETFDQSYAPGFDTIVTAGLAPERLVPHKDLIVELQKIHDMSGNWTHKRINMRDQLLILAQSHRLDTSVVYELWAPAA